MGLTLILPNMTAWKVKQKEARGLPPGARGPWGGGGEGQNLRQLVRGKNELACAKEMGSERSPSGGSDKPIAVPTRKVSAGNICHSQRKQWQLEPPRPFCLCFPTLVPEALGSLVSVEDGRGSGLGEIQRKIATEVWSFALLNCSKHTNYYITLYFFNEK